MKNAQNEFGKSAEKLLSANTTTAQPVSSSSSSTSPVRNSIENVENAHNNNKNSKATAAREAANMNNDKHQNDNNNDSSNNINNNGDLIAEAAKILLKNGLNGTSAAAAALITAATSFQLPKLPSTPPLLSHGVTDCVGNQLDPPPAHVASSSKVTTMSSAVAVSHLSQRNNGIAPSSSHFKTTKDRCTNATSGAVLMGKSISTSNIDSGVIDYTLGTASNGTQKPLSATSTCGSGNTGGFVHGGGGGGRLQFFKDGKFILELARSKDGERGGWVSVPRKHFRQPSATTSTVTPASTSNAFVYPKMETCTSLSFSDDNSSIQSSPWQRDHCWKQTTPKRNISKEMSVYYRLPKDIIMTKAGIQIAKRKRRRPYDDTVFNLGGIKLFERCADNIGGHDISFPGETKECQSTHSLQNGKIINAVKNEDEDRCSSSSASTLVGDNDVSNAEENGNKSETGSITAENVIDDDKKKLAKAAECEAKSTIQNEKNSAKDEIDDKNVVGEKMNTSEDGDEMISMTPNEKQLVVSDSAHGVENVKLKAVDIHDAVQSKTGVEEKRLNKRKLERAKLTSIVQKLIDRMPTRVSNLSKVTLPNSSSNHQQNTNFLSNKVSPTSSSSSTSPSLAPSVSGTASRLVEYHHQQHVSPRKRILREFEKVSLEDNAAACGAGGKRSRAKSNANTTVSANYRNARSPNNRVQSNTCVLPSTSTIPTSTAVTPSSNGESSQNLSTTSNSSKQLKNATSTNVPPTRLYSSYSIHSLLGDQSNSSNSSSKSTASKQNIEQSTSVSNIGYHHHNQHQQQQSVENSFNVRKSVSPKSPEVGGGKSPSSNAANKKRSPPYASPMHDSLSRSPSVNNSVDYSLRATPPEFKQRYGAFSLSEQQHNSLSGNSSHHLHQQNHRLLQGAFYSPYMMSPKYVSNSGNLNTGATSPPSTSRSPRHSNTAFTSPTTSTTIASANTQNIPNSYSSHLVPPLQSELSPSRPLADFSRESTPRTVPKKTASIRRQFASPTASTNSTTNNTSCPSPSERIGEECLSDTKTSNSVSTTAAYQQLLQRSSPSAALSSPLHAAAYYMYPPATPLASGASNSSPIAHAAPTSAYIPSYYHSYLSALNITKHYYLGAGASQSAASRLSSPFHPMTIPYNGVSAAAVAAAAAAAAATAAFSGQTHMGHHPMLPPPTAASATALYGVGGGFGLGLSVSSTSTNTAPQSHKSTDSNMPVMNADITGESTISTGTTTTASVRSTQYSSNKDEHSSDVPLNLSKH